MSPSREVHQKRGRRRDLGQYFTPPAVVEFMFEMTRVLSGIGTSEPRVVDPACGAGAFLLHALRTGFTAQEKLFGVEQDSAMGQSWEETGLSDALGSHLHVQDGLCDTADGQVRPDAFDLVIGNPPFGVPAGDAVKPDGARSALGRLTLWRGPHELAQEKLPTFTRRPPTDADRQRIARFPVEILFLERFVQLARPGGQVAVILPDGVFSNSRYQYVRDWTHRQCQIDAVVSLPTTAFRHARTTAKTSILFCRRRAPDVAASDPPVLLAALKEIDTAGFRDVLAAAAPGRGEV